MTTLITIPNKRLGLSPTSMIVSKLLEESKGGAMLDRLQVKLGKTKEEVYKLVSEL